MIGKFHCQEVATLPTWKDSYHRRFIMVSEDGLYFGLETKWLRLLDTDYSVPTAEAIDGITMAATNSYYGTNELSGVGFYSLETKWEEFLTSHSPVPTASAIDGADEAGINYYYGTDELSAVGFYSLPLKISEYLDENSVPKADDIDGADEAGINYYYGTDSLNASGFFKLSEYVSDYLDENSVPKADEIDGADTEGIDKYYGTNALNVVGFFSLPVVPDYIVQYFSKSTDPMPSDDEVDGYEIGSVWMHENENKLYFCYDPTSGHAEWDRLTTATELKRSFLL